MLPNFVEGYWDETANGKPAAAAFPRSTQVADWHCPTCDHRWQQRIGILVNKQQRVLDGKASSLCPACDGKVITEGVDDLETLNPQLARLWSIENDKPLRAYTRASATMGKWACEAGHTWQRRIKYQVQSPYCATCKRAARQARPAQDGLLAEVAPDLYTELDHDRNAKLLGLDSREMTVRGNTNTELNWLCPVGHPYQAKLANRLSLGRGCPKCSGREAIVGETDLVTTDPEIVATYWDFTTNAIEPSTLKRGSNKVCAWHCPQGHTWQARVSNLTMRGHFCPVCSGKRLLPKTNDLAVRCPLAPTHWHPTRNGTLRPADVMSATRQRVWWQCPTCSHEFQEMIFVVSRALNRTGRFCPACSGKVVVAGQNDWATHNMDIIDEWDTEANQFGPTEVSHASAYRAAWICQICKHHWQIEVYHRDGQNRTGCPACAKSATSSRGEDEIAAWLQEVGLTVERHRRGLLDGQAEIDIWLPAHNLGIEFNGVYWHAEPASIAGDKYRHQRKYDAATRGGLQLLQIWEDEWRDRQSVVKAGILHRLGLSDELRIFARNTQVVTLDNAGAQRFMESNHIQGHVTGSYHIALVDKRDLSPVAVMTLKRRDDGKTLELLRYATSRRVVGGFTKLLAWSERTYDPTAIVTFSDNCISDGNLYRTTGFTLDKRLEPDYRYVVGNRREHKFKYRIARFKNDPNLLWQPGMSERELAALNGMRRIWDAGKIRWVKHVTPSA